MEHRSLLRPVAVVAVLAALALAVVASAAAPASAGSTVALNGIKTTLTSDPGTTRALLKNLIVPLPVAPTNVQLCFFCGPMLTYSSPITDGSVDAQTLAGQINHSGGIRFLSLRTFKSLTLTNFTIDINEHPDLTAEVNGDPQTRLSILDLDLSAAQVVKSPPYVTVSDVGAALTATAAAALNATFGTTLFQPGLKLGIATVYARIAG
jgi:hypothetical protein